MNIPFRTSPLADQLKRLNAPHRKINGMLSLFTLPDQIEVNQAEKAAQIGIADLSFLTRFGVKGAGAAAWLESAGIPVPDRPNTWYPLSTGGLVARLGSSEFLIEDSLHSRTAWQLAEKAENPPAQVYPVLRQDAAIALSGEAVNELLLQTCAINFRALRLSDRPVLLTAMVGVGVTVIPGERSEQPLYRIWCDGTFGNYLWRTLLAIAEELGGGAVGADQFV